MRIAALVIAALFVPQTPTAVPVPRVSTAAARTVHATVSHNDQRTVAGIIISLHRVENELLRQSALKEAGFTEREEEILKITGRLKTALIGPTCDPGLCQQWGVCVPCRPGKNGKKVYDRLIAISLTLHIVENRLLVECISGSPEFGAHLKTAVTETARAMKVMSLTQCEPGTCQIDGICLPCD